MALVKNFGFLFFLFFGYDVFSAQSNNNYFKELKEKISSITQYNSELEESLAVIKKEYFREKNSQADYPPCDIINDIFLSFFKSIKVVNTCLTKFLQKKYKKNGLHIVNSNILTQGIIIAEACSSYIYSQILIKQEFYKIKFYKEIKKLLSDGLLDIHKKDNHMLECARKIDEIFSKFDNYIKEIVDVLELINDSKSFDFSDIYYYLVINLSEKIIDDRNIIYKLKKNNKNITHLILEKNEYDNKFFVLIASFSDSNFFWYKCYKNNFSKIYIDQKTAENGILFAFFEKSMRFFIYHTNSSFPSNKDWSILSNNDVLNPVIIESNKRVKNTYYNKFSTDILFVNFENIDVLEDLINKLKKHGLLTFELFIEIINWIASVESDYKIIDEKILPFYPKELRIKEIEYINKVIKKEKKVDNNLNKIYLQNFVKEPKDYKNILENVLGDKKSIGCKMLKKCVNLWWKSKDKKQKSSQKGSHIKLENNGEKSIVIVKPHDRKASSGVPAWKIKKLLLEQKSEEEKEI